MADIDLPALTLSLPEIDEDHAASVELWRAAAAAGPAEFVERLAAFVDHLGEHFAREEALMRAVDYKEIAHHVAEHARTVGEARRFLEQARAGRTVMARAYVAEMVPDWFRRHVLMFDSEVARVVKLARSRTDPAATSAVDG
jgi:hemerythrin